MKITAVAAGLVAVVLLAGPWMSGDRAHALPPRPTPEPIDEVEEPPFEPPVGGFDWSVPNRFSVFRWNDVRDSTPAHGGPPETYDPAYVHPTSFPMDFNGCPNESEAALAARRQATQYTYIWEVAGTTTSVRSCLHRHVFTAQGSYPARLTISDAGAVVAIYDQTVRVRDFLIVSLGDSYASGEGNPDVPQIPSVVFPFLEQQVDWVDDRCHRSFWGGPTQAAQRLELADPKTSVTYLSFACSGATIATETFRNGNALDPYERVGVSVGTGVLGNYAGILPPGNPPDFSNRVPSQIEQLRQAIGTRSVDAVMMSAGGNDVGFGPVAATCVLYGPNCPDVLVSPPVGTVKIPLRDRFAADVATLPAKYAALAQSLTQLGIPPQRVYITEYPDPTTAIDGNLCASILEDILPGGASISGAEVSWARTDVLRGLNNAVAAAAAAHGWKHVGGIETAFVGHGYCSSDGWIRRAADSTVLQGPYPALFNESTTGTLHPTAQGHAIYRERLFAALQADLDLGPGAGAPPPPPVVAPPSFQATWVKGALTGRFGENGWLLGPAVLTVDATAATTDSRGNLVQNGIRSVGLAVDATPGCPTAALVCTGGLVNAQTHRSTFEATQEGVFQIELVAGDTGDRTARALYEMKVDLADPSASAEPAGSGWSRVPVQITLRGADTPTGSGIKALEYRLDGAAPVVVSNGSVVTVTGDGMHTLAYRAGDWAGRTSTSQTLQVGIDSGSPTIACASPDGQWHTSDVSITCTATDSLSGLANAADATFTLVASVPIGVETANASTDSRTVCDRAGNCATAGPIAAIKIDRKPPVLTVPANFTVNATNPAGTPVTYVATATDGSGQASVSCTPASGSTIAIGTTTVSCTATDAAVNIASASFNVTVKGATEQILDLLQATIAVTLPPDVKSQLTTAVEKILADIRNVSLVCRGLDAYLTLVRARAGRSIPTATATRLITDATRIKAVLGCS